jgi:hypothetical protein
MSTELVRIGLPKEQAENMRTIRRIKQWMDQAEAAHARVDARLKDQILQEVSAEQEMPLPTAANA